MDKSKWEYKKLGDICILLNGFAFKSEKYVDNGIRVMRITNVQKGEIVDDDPKFYPMSSQSEIQRYMLKENDLLVSLTGNVGRVGLLQRELLPAALNQRVACLRLKGDSTDLRYLFHLMNSDLFENECIVNSQGIAQKNMSTKWLSDYKLPVPPKEDQQRIVAELDCLNEMIAVKQEQLKEFDKLAQSIFYDMFGDPVANEKGWEKKTIGEVASFYNGKAHENDIDKNGEFILVNAKFIASEGLVLKRTNKQLFPLYEKDIVMVMSDVPNGKALARCYLIKHNNIYSLNQRICAFRDYSQNPIFLLFLLNRNKYYLRFDDGNGQTNLRKNDVLGCPIILPPLALQQQFAEKISAIEAQKELVKQSIAETQHLLDYTMDKYFG